MARLGTLENIALFLCVRQASRIIRVRAMRVRNDFPARGELLPSPLSVVIPIEPPDHVHDCVSLRLRARLEHQVSTAELRYVASAKRSALNCYKGRIRHASSKTMGVTGASMV